MPTPRLIGFELVTICEGTVVAAGGLVVPAICADVVVAAGATTSLELVVGAAVLASAAEFCVGADSVVAAGVGAGAGAGADVVAGTGAGAGACARCGEQPPMVCGSCKQKGHGRTTGIVGATVGNGAAVGRTVKVGQPSSAVKQYGHGSTDASACNIGFSSEACTVAGIVVDATDAKESGEAAAGDGGAKSSLRPSKWVCPILQVTSL
jgi:hypothetical protein